METACTNSPDADRWQLTMTQVGINSSAQLITAGTYLNLDGLSLGNVGAVGRGTMVGMWGACIPYRWRLSRHAWGSEDSPFWL